MQGGGRDHREALTSLRISSHRLRVERGRYTRPKTARGNRICTWCEKKEKIEIEDEVHFILECDMAKGIRERMVVFDWVRRKKRSRLKMRCISFWSVT